MFFIHGLAAFLAILPCPPASGGHAGQGIVRGDRSALHGDELEDPTGEDLGADPRRDLLQRDERLSFTSGAADRARRYLRTEVSGLDPREIVLRRASALMALGCGGADRDIKLLESFAESGKLTVRRAAALALGEMGVRALAPIHRLLQANVVGMEETLLLALLRVGTVQPAAERLVQDRFRELLNDERPSLRGAARFLGEYALGGAPPRALPTLDNYYELRWEAAREYGFIDGLRWTELKLAELLRDERFIARFLLGTVERLPLEIVRSHLIELLQGHHGPGVVRGIMRGAPGALEYFFAEGLWRPASEAEWRELYDGLRADLPRDSSAGLLRGAFDGVPALRDEVALLMMRAGVGVPTEWLEEMQGGSRPELIPELLEAIGGLGESSQVPGIRLALGRYADERIQLTGTIALVRLGDGEAWDRLASTLRGASGAERLRIVRGLGAHARDPLVARLLAVVLEGQALSAEESIALAIGMAREGRVIRRDILRKWLRSGREPRAERAFVARTLGSDPTAEDRALFRELFPAEDEFDLNLELALVLGRERDPLALQILSTALWGESWNLSVIAGGLMEKHLGLRALLDELHTPPVHATDEKLRCVGFSIGEWGGLPAAEELARTLNERDPGLQGAYLGALAQRHP